MDIKVIRSKDVMATEDLLNIKGGLMSRWILWKLSVSVTAGLEILTQNQQHLQNQ